MYHIKNDKRSRASAAEIAACLNQILKTQSLSSVTISRIHEQTGISRATFYRLFDNVEDVIIYQCDQLVEQAVGRYNSRSVGSALEAVRSIMAMGFEYHDLLEALVANRRFDLLYEYTARRIFTYDALKPLLTPDMNEAAIEYFLSNMSMAMVATLTTWTRRGSAETPDQVRSYSMHYWRFIRDLVEEEMRHG